MSDPLYLCEPDRFEMCKWCSGTGKGRCGFCVGLGGGYHHYGYRHW